MDRRRHHFLAVAFSFALVLLAGRPVADATVEPSPASSVVPTASPSPSAKLAPLKGDAAFASPSLSPKPAASLPPTPVPPQKPPSLTLVAPSPATPAVTATPTVARPSPAFSGPLRNLLPPRTGMFGEANPRPWEWRLWTQEERNRANEENKVVPPMALPGTAARNADAEGSAAVQKMVENLPPDERDVFMRNLKRWALLTTDERQTLRRQATERHQRMQEEMDNALSESGLQLDEDHREMFMLRYGQERRKLERELQEKLAAERARRTPDLIQRLKREFAPAAVSPPPSAPPAATVGPPVATVGPSPTPRL